MKLSELNKPLDRLAIIRALEGKYIKTRNGWRKVEDSEFQSFYGPVNLRGHSVEKLKRWLETSKETID